MDIGCLKRAGWLACLAGMLAVHAAVAGVDAMTGQGSVKQVCVGQFVLELPASAKVEVAGSYKGIEVERHMATDFDAIVAALRVRADEYGARKVEQDPYAAAIYRSGGVDPDGLFGESQLLGFDADQSRQVAVLGYHKQSGSPEITVEVHRILDQARHVFSVENLGADKYLAVRDSVLRASGRYRPLAPGEVPDGPGFCVGTGLFEDESARDVGGDATLVAQFPEYSNVSFSVDVSGIAQVAREGGLQSRVDSDLGFLATVASGARTLRRGQKRYASQDGYLIAVSVEDDEGRVQKFFWGTDGVPNDSRQPLVEIQLVAGESGPSPLTDAEMGELWDRLLEGFRLR